MRKLNKDIERQASNKKNQHYFQTNLFDFLKFEKSNDTKNIKQLQKIPHNQQVKENFRSFLKILNDNDTNWIAIENNKYFVSSDKHLIVSDLLNYKSLIKLPKLVKFLFKVSSLNDFNEIIIKKGEKNNVRIQEFNYYLSNINETYRILSLPFKISQNDEGLLICTNMNKIILIAPKLI